MLLSVIRSWCGIAMAMVALETHGLANTGFDEWFPRTLRSVPHQIIQVGDVYYGVARDGKILRSSDGIEWREHVISAIERFNDIAFGNGLIVAVGQSGTVWISKDGTNWNHQSKITEGNLKGVTFGKGNFVAVGNPSAAVSEVHLSTDGVHWETSVRPNSSLTDVTFFKDHFVALSGSRVISSPDARNWKTNLSNAIEAYTMFANSNERLVTLEQSGLLAYTDDNSAWNVTRAGYETQFRGLAYTQGRFLAAGWQNTITRPCMFCTPTQITLPSIAISTNGAVWSFVPAPQVGAFLTKVYSTEDRFVIADSSNVRWTSPDGTNWMHVTSDTMDDFSATAFGNGTFVAVGSSTKPGASEPIPLAAVSTDGLRWQRSPSLGIQEGALSSLCFGNGQFLALAPAYLAIHSTTNTNPIPAKLLSSLNGMSWQVHSVSTNWKFLNLTFGRERFLALGQDADGKQLFLLSSANGVDWAQVGNGIPEQVMTARLVYTGGSYFIVGRRSQPEGGMILKSTNGLDWESFHGEPWDIINDVAYGNGYFVAGGSLLPVFHGNTGFTMISTNGTHWQKSSSIQNRGVASIEFLNNQFIVAGHPENVTLDSSPAIWTSQNGTSWILRNAGGVSLTSIATDGRSVIAVGHSGAIVQSGHLIERATNAPPQLLGADRIGEQTLRLALFSTSSNTNVSLETSSNLSQWMNLREIEILNKGVTEITLPMTNSGYQFFRLQSF